MKTMGISMMKHPQVGEDGLMLAHHCESVHELGPKTKRVQP